MENIIAESCENSKLPFLKINIFFVAESGTDKT